MVLLWLGSINLTKFYTNLQGSALQSTIKLLWHSGLDDG